MKKLLIICIFLNLLYAKDNITTNDVYYQIKLISFEIHSLLKYYNITHDHEGIQKRVNVVTKFKQRNVWQKSYEIMIKINILRSSNKLPIIEPVNMAPVLNLNPDLVYEQTQRILTEIKIFKDRLGIKYEKPIFETFKGKTPLDVFNGLSAISAGLDELNKGELTPSYVFGENMRVYHDVTQILDYLNIEDKTIPAKKNIRATLANAFNTGMLILNKIKELQISSGIDFVDFNKLRKSKQNSSNVFSITEMIIAELQTIKAYLGIQNITSAASSYSSKTPVEVDQLMSWNLRKLNLINSLNIRKK